MKTGYIQVYTGNGKGKTTASLGLALRAAGAGMRVCIIQFMKKGDYSEIQALKRFEDLILVEQYGAGKFVRGKPSEEEIAACRKGYQRLTGLLESGDWDVVIAEEANVALWCGLFSEQDMFDLMDKKPAHVELILTGRGATEAVMDRADLVTEMREVKHYYQAGVAARKGIEK